MNGTDSVKNSVIDLQIGENNMTANQKSSNDAQTAAVLNDRELIERELHWFMGIHVLTDKALIAYDLLRQDHEPDPAIPISADVKPILEEMIFLESIDNSKDVLYTHDPSKSIAFFHALICFLAETQFYLIYKGYLNEQKVDRKVEKAELIYLPLAKRLNIHIYVSELQELIFEYRNPDKYKRIKDAVKEIYDSNKHNDNKTLDRIRTLPVNKIDQIDILERRIFSIARNIDTKQPVGRKRGRWILSKYTEPLYDIHIVIKDDSPLTVFMDCYINLLKGNGILIKGVYPTFDGTNQYLLMTDSCGMSYRVFLYSPAGYYLFMYGRNLSDNSSLSLTDQLKDFQNANIVILTRDNYKMVIPKNSTVLDFALKLHKDIGTRMQYALINGRKVQKLSTVLQDGDKVEIVSSSKDEPPLAQLGWMRWVNTSAGKKALYDYFNNNVIMISVSDRFGKYIYIPWNSSVLDYLLIKYGSVEYAPDYVMRSAKAESIKDQEVIKERILRRALRLLGQIDTIQVNKNVPVPLKQAIETKLSDKSRIVEHFDDLDKKACFVPKNDFLIYLNTRVARSIYLDMIHVYERTDRK